MYVLDLFCGLGGFSEPFRAAGISVIGVDLNPGARFPGPLVVADARDCGVLIASAHAVLASPPCEEFARAHLPWMRKPDAPAREAVELLSWAVELSRSRPRVLVECSAFAARYVPGGVRVGSWVLWGDVPFVLSPPRRDKTQRSGTDKQRRAAVPWEIGRAALWHWFRK